VIPDTYIYIYSGFVILNNYKSVHVWRFRGSSHLGATSMWSPGLQLTVMHVETIQFWSMALVLPPQCDITEVWLGRQVKYFWNQITVSEELRDAYHVWTVPWDSMIWLMTLHISDN